MSDCEGLSVDDSASAASMEVTDRIASLEQRVQMQEDEIQLLKSALADVVRRLNLSEEQQALGSRRGPTKARPMIATLPVRPTVNNGTIQPKKGSSLPSPSGTGSRKDTSTAAIKSLSSLSSLYRSRILNLSLSTVRRANSNEHVSTLTRKDSSDSKGNRTRAGSNGSNASSKRSDSKQREPVFNAGMRRVTHCKVTVQLYLGRSAALAQKKPSAGSVGRSVPGDPASRPRHTPDSGRVRGPRQGAVSRPPAVRKPPSFSPPLRQSGSYSPLDTPSYCSPLKSPSQYFQLCY